MALHGGGFFKRAETKVATVIGMRKQREFLSQPVDHRLGRGPDNLRAIHGGHDVVEQYF
ncbi:hypothetical protein D3C87_1605400 [compost metagenome]